MKEGREGWRSFSATKERYREEERKKRKGVPDRKGDRLKQGFEVGMMAFFFISMLSFFATKVTRAVEGMGCWALRLFW